MPSASALGIFVASAIALLVIPGPAVLYIVAQSVQHGRRAGLVGMLGIQAGGLVHVIGAAVGISAILASSATAFSAVKYAGAAYLVWLGVRRLTGRDASSVSEAAQERPAQPLGRIFRQGVVVNILNPKTALFFLAFLPQFVDPDRGAAWAQTLALGGVFLALAALSDGVWALGAGTAAAWLRRRRRGADVERYATGTILVGLGVMAAFTHPAKR